MIFQVFGWLISVGLTIFLLWTAPRRGAAFVVKAAIASIVLGLLSFTGIGLALRRIYGSPPDSLLLPMLQVTMTVIAMAMLNVMNIVFHRIVDAQIAFHTRYNAANLQRFPVSFVIRNAAQLKTFGTAFWCLGAAFMLYALWFKMEAPA